MNSNEPNHELIESVSDLVSALSDGERTTYSEILKSLNLPSSDYECFDSWSNSSYTRNCLVDNEDFELILLCWEKGQVTPIHDHGGEECWVKIIEGEFRETIYKMDEGGNLNTLRSSTAKKGDLTYMIDFMGCHRLENISDKRSMSLHLYAKPIRSCGCFDEKSNTFVSKELEYCTVSELVEN